MERRSAMGEEAFEEYTLPLELGGVLVLRRLYGAGNVLLGLGDGKPKGPLARPGDTHSDEPDLLLELTPFDQVELRKLLRQRMSAKQARDEGEP